LHGGVDVYAAHASVRIDAEFGGKGRFRMKTSYPLEFWTDTNHRELGLTIDEIREQIDALDDELLKIFNRRAALALAIGEIKKTEGRAVYDPNREQNIFDRMQASNPGPLDNGAIVRLYERVIDETRRLERIRTKGE